MGLRQLIFQTLKWSWYFCKLMALNLFSILYLKTVLNSLLCLLCFYQITFKNIYFFFLIKTDSKTGFFLNLRPP